MAAADVLSVRLWTYVRPLISSSLRMRPKVGCLHLMVRDVTSVSSKGDA